MKLKTLFVIFILILSNTAFAQVDKEYCNKSNLEKSILAHIWGSKSVLLSMSHLAQHAESAILQLGLKSASSRSSVDWKNFEIKSCVNESDFWGAGEIDFKVKIFYMIDPVGKDSFISGELEVSGTMIGDLIYETVEFQSKLRKSYKTCESDGTTGIKVITWENAPQLLSFQTQDEAAEELKYMQDAGLCGYEIFED